MTGSERREEGRARDDVSRAPGMFFFWVTITPRRACKRDEESLFIS